MDLERLVARLEEGGSQTRRYFLRAGIIIGALFATTATITAIQGQYDAAVFLGVFGLAFVALMAAAMRKASRERASPVLDAIRNAPERVTSVAHSTTSDARRLVVSHWITVKSGDHTLRVRANQDWEELLDVLQRRCG